MKPTLPLLSLLLLAAATGTRAEQAKSLQDLSVAAGPLPTATTCDASKIKDIAVIGTVHEGQVFPAKRTEKQTAHIKLPETFKPVAYVPVSTEHGHTHAEGGCACSTGKASAEPVYPPTRN